MKDRIPLTALCFFLTIPASAQIRTTPTASANAQEDDEQLPSRQPQPRIPLRTDQAGQVAESSVGQVGQRQTREQAPAGIKPMARVTSRIQNRVQNRIRNRIDRNYDPRANATDPFSIAEEQAQTSNRPNR